MDVIELRPIGIVHNGVTEAVDEGWGSVVSRIALRPDLGGALDGLADFSHVLVLYWMHEAPPPDALRRRPRGLRSMPEVGILAQRARHRPNPIGVTAAEVLAVTEQELTVRGLDAIDGTPVLDLKPYVPAFDRPEGVRGPAWIDRLMMGYFADADGQEQEA